MTYEGYLSGPRWSGIKKFLFQLSTMCDLTFKVLEEDKGFIGTTIYFQVEGSETNVQIFEKKFHEEVTNHNSFI